MNICRLGLYLFLVILIGGAGCWIALGQYYFDPLKYEYRSFISNLGTFSISIAILAYADRILSKKQLNTTVALFIFVLMILSAVLSGLCIVVYFKFSTIAAALSLVGALACWTMVNWNSPEFTDKPDPFTTLGGDPTKTSA
jgi:hypothetical protein